MKLRNILLTALILRGGIEVLQAQPVRGNRPETILAVADEKFDSKDYYNAADWLQRYYETEKDKTTAYKIATCYELLHDYAKAESWYARVLDRERKQKANDYPDARFRYAKMLKMNEKYDDAQVALEDFLTETQDDKLKKMAKIELEGVKLAKTMGESNKVAIENGGNILNTPNEEYSPSLAPDGTLYFVAYRSMDIITLDGKQGDYKAKIFAARRSDKGKWEKPTVVGGDVNRADIDQGNVCISKDGNMMYFTRVELDGNVLGKSKLFYAKKNGGEWGPAREVGSLNGNYIIKHPALGELFGKQVLFFVSNMEGSKGGSDIFYAEVKGEGSFGLPTNLGDAINTINDEETPFYSDGKLYFSSNGHPSIGGLDVFVANWNGSTWTNITNMGKPYNSSVDDRFFSVDDFGNGFVVSNRAGGRSLKSKTCCDDIWVISKAFSLDLKTTALEDGQPSKGNVEFRLFEGNTPVGDASTGANFESSLRVDKTYRIIASKQGFYGDTLTFNTVGIRESQVIQNKVNLKRIPPPKVVKVDLHAVAYEGNNPSTGGVTFTLVQEGVKGMDSKTGADYKSGLSLNKSYMLIAAKQGFVSDTVKFSTSDIYDSKTIAEKLTLKPIKRIIKTSEKIALKNIYYKYNDDKIVFEEAKVSLDYLYGIMTKYPDMKIELGSHTDARGNDTYNLDLSQRRAESARQYLIAKGIAADRIVARGYGETELVNSCKNGVKCSEDEHQQNRRTEFKILSGPTTIEVEQQQ